MCQLRTHTYRTSALGSAGADQVVLHVGKSVEHGKHQPTVAGAGVARGQSLASVETHLGAAAPAPATLERRSPAGDDGELHPAWTGAEQTLHDTGGQVSCSRSQRIGPPAVGSFRSYP